ncbi:MAG: hypothetical protein CMB11_04820 [Euryarchaeota archaeon]|nr:hypothetical protein [Euryarchaeota archaeon]|tara:strand:- start:10028 stop:10390 length:363 start_codon:yes stop_codon:yes gene_type:complete
MDTWAPRSHWSETELDVLRYLLHVYGHRRLNYTRVARLFENRTAAEVRHRATCMRDLARRKQRRAERRALLARAEEAASPTSVVDQLLPLEGQLLPLEGQLHPEVVWVPPTVEEIGQINL